MATKKKWCLSMINNERASGKKIIAGISWTFTERITAQVASFIVSIVLARLLDPSVYGLLALANILISIMNALSLTGFGPSLIQKKEATITDFSSTLLFSFFVGICAYLVLFLSAPLLSSFFNADGLTSVIRVTGLVLITASVNVIQRAYLIRNLQFNKLFVSSLFDSFASAAIGIFLAYKGFGIWALVAQLLIKSVTDIVVLIFISDFRPKLVLSLKSIKEIYQYGWKLILASLIDALYEQSRSIVIGKKYNESDLAYYDKGMQFPTLFINNINTSIANVMISAISREQDDLSRVRNMVRKSVKTSSFILFPLLIGMMVCSRAIISILLTDKWLPSVPYMQLLCVAFMLKPIQTAGMQGILAIGRSDLYLKVRTAQKIVGLTVLLVSALCWDTPLAIAAGEVVAYVLFFMIIAIPNRNCIDYRIKDQLFDLLPQLLIAAVMGAAVFAVGYLLSGIPTIITLIVLVVVGGIIYIGVSYLFKISAFCEMKSIIQLFVNGKGGKKDA